MSKRMPPVHPGEVLREEFLRPLNISINRLARDIHVPVSRISKISNEQRGISAETAMRFSRYFGTSPEFWMNLQSRYDLRIAEQEALKAIRREVLPRERSTRSVAR
jgi:antitoxin HigA-1